MNEHGYRSLIDRARFEIAEDRRIAALAKQQRTKSVLEQRARVTEELVTEVERLRRSRLGVREGEA